MELFDRNQNLVGFCFKKYVGDYMTSDFEDIMQEGLLGLWQAAQRYDESKEVKFTTFAVHYIFGTMKRYMREKRNVIRIPRSAFESKDVDLISSLRSIASLDAEIPQANGSSIQLSDLIEDKSEEYKFITSDLIDNFIATIENSEHKHIMRDYYYAYVWDKSLTQEELAEKYKISQPTISRIIKKYTIKFQEYLNNL